MNPQPGRFAAASNGPLAVAANWRSPHFYAARMRREARQFAPPGVKCPRRARRALAVLLAWLTVAVAGAAAEPAAFQFRTNDVIAFVGGEDVVEMQHNGYLELLLTTALPHHKLA